MAALPLEQAQAKFSIGIIGMGDMGRMYARRLSEAGWSYVPFSLNSLFPSL
jgi:prephenate dehydrogenase (NADP+)